MSDQMNLTEEAKEKRIEKVRHVARCFDCDCEFRVDAFNGVRNQMCPSCHAVFPLQFDAALRSQWVRIEDGEPDAGKLVEITVEGAVSKRRVVALARCSKTSGKTFWYDPWGHSIRDGIIAWRYSDSHPYQEETE